MQNYGLKLLLQRRSKLKNNAISQLIEDICRDLEGMTNRGEVADYIPQLACARTEQFAMSVCTSDGKQFSGGDAKVDFSVQSVSKLFTLALALGRLGEDLWTRVGREPSNNAFNSAHELEERQGHPSNPFVNSGAIVTTDALLSGSAPKETLAEILQFVRTAASDNDIFIDAAVAKSENETGHRNRALAHILTASGNLNHPVDFTLGTYFHHCAIAMTCEQLARFGRFLAGIHPLGTLISPQQVRSINALMMTSGHYNGSGEFAFRVGVPAKSGVGGGILAVVPGVASIAVWSPGLDSYGNSLLGTLALERLCTELDWSVFSSLKKP